MMPVNTFPFVYKVVQRTFHLDSDMVVMVSAQPCVRLRGTRARAYRNNRIRMSAASFQPHIAPSKPHEVVTPNGSKRNDPYAWLRDDRPKDKKDSEIIKYLKDENGYAMKILEANSGFEKRILYDMDSRVPRHETTPATPSADLSYWYGSRRGPGQDYYVHTRRPALTKLQGPATKGPLSYAPDLKASEQVVLDVNALSDGYSYYDVGAIKPSPDGRYVAFTVDTVGDEEYEVVVHEIATGRRVPFVGAEAPSKPRDLGGMPNCGSAVEWAADSSSVFALLLTHEAYKLVRCKLVDSDAAAARQDPEVLLKDDTSGAVLELAGHTSCGTFLMLFRKADGYSTLLALTLPSSGGSTRPVKQPTRGVPKGVTLYGNDPWVVVAPESSAFDVLRADHLYSHSNGIETFAVLMDSDKYPDGFVCAVTGGDLKHRAVLVPGSKGRQVVDIAVVGGCGGAAAAAAAANEAHSSGAAAHNAAAHGQRYLVVQLLEDMAASVQVYDATAVREAVAARVASHAHRRRQRRRRRAAAKASSSAAENAPAAKEDDEEEGGDDSSDDDKYDDDDGDDDDGGDGDGDDSENGNRQQQGDKAEKAAAASQPPVPAASANKQQPPGVLGGGGALLLPLHWTYSPGPAISSLHLDHSCWPGTLPYIRLSYSNLTTRTTTVDVDLPAKKADVREVERVEYYTAGQYMSQTLWATSYDGTKVPVTVACRTDAWPLTTGRPLPVILQAYGAYGRKLLPDFIPGDLAMLDGGTGAAADAAAAKAKADGDGAAAAAAAEAVGPCLMVLAHVRGGGELGSYWHVDGKRFKKINTEEDIAAAVRMLVDKGLARPDAVAVWGRSAGGLAMGMALERTPPGTFRAAILDVPFVDVLGAMTDPSLPLTIKERSEWGDPYTYQEDYDYILSYSPYDNVAPLATNTPALIVTCSINDPRVPYWGPAKFVARLRAAMAAAAANNSSSAGGGSTTTTTTISRSGPVMLLTELDAGGHFAASGASGKLADRAMRVAFLLRQLKRAVDEAAAAAGAKQ